MALILPQLIASHQKKVLETSFKKAYSEIGQVVQAFVADEAIIPRPNDLENFEFLMLLSKYFVPVKKCFSTYGMSTSCFESNITFAVWFDSFYHNYSKKKIRYDAHWWFDDGMMILSDGAFIFVDCSTSENYLISVDTNGLKARRMHCAR